jgi:hypothetical protein
LETVSGSLAVREREGFQKLLGRLEEGDAPSGTKSHTSRRTFSMEVDHSHDAVDTNKVKTNALHHRAASYGHMKTADLTIPVREGSPG